MSGSWPKVIRDPVHNIIPFENTPSDRLLLDLINAKEFQRLRRIKQLGVSELVFPGANHSRFAHSIGVMHTARMFLDRIQRVLGEELTEEQRMIVLAAALIHDVGHGPFSHAFESIVQDKHEARTLQIIRDDTTEVHRCLAAVDPELPERVAMFFDEEIGEEDWPESSIPSYLTQVVSSQLDADRFDYLLRDSYATGTVYGQFDHLWLINQLHLQPGDRSDLRLISAVDDMSDIPTEGHNLIIIADMQNVLRFRIFDAEGKRVVDTDETQRPDKADQIAELKSRLNNLWGGRQLPRSDKDSIITTVTSIVDPIHRSGGRGPNRKGRFYLSSKALYVAEAYLFARHHMYRTVYFHKTTRAAEVMLRLVFKRYKQLIDGATSLAERRRIVPGAPRGLLRAFSTRMSLRQYLLLDDHTVTEFLKSCRLAQDGLLKELALGLLDRRLYKATDVTDIHAAEISDFTDAAKAKVRELRLDPDYTFVRDKPANIPYKPYDPTITNPAVQIYVESASGAPREISELSRPVSQLKEGYILLRYYYPATIREEIARIAAQTLKSERP